MKAMKSESDKPWPSSSSDIQTSVAGADVVRRIETSAASGSEQDEVRRLLATEWNAALPISHLPPDILAVIFMACLDAMRMGFYIGKFRVKPYSWICISHVCQYWRAVALEYPLLWCWLVKTSTTFTQLLLQRSGQAPLIVDALRSKRNARWSKSALKAVYDFWYRIKEADISLSKMKQRNISAPLLRRLGVLDDGRHDGGRPSDAPPIFLDIPSLRQLHWNSGSGSSSSCWHLLQPLLISQLEELSIRLDSDRPDPSMSFDAWTSVLRNMRNLRVLALKGAISSSLDFQVPNAKSIVLPNLRDLTLATTQYLGRTFKSPEVALLTSMGIPTTTKIHLTILHELSDAETDALITVLSARASSIEASHLVFANQISPELYSWSITSRRAGGCLPRYHDHLETTLQVYYELSRCMITRLCSRIPLSNVTSMQFKSALVFIVPHGHRGLLLELSTAMFRPLTKLKTLVIKQDIAAVVFLRTLDALSSQSLRNLEDCTFDKVLWKRHDSRLTLQDLALALITGFKPSPERKTPLRILRLRDTQQTISAEDIASLRTKNCADIVEWDGEGSIVACVVQMRSKAVYICVLGTENVQTLHVVWEDCSSLRLKLVASDIRLVFYSLPLRIVLESGSVDSNMPHMDLPSSVQWFIQEFKHQLEVYAAHNDVLGFLATQWNAGSAVARFPPEILAAIFMEYAMAERTEYYAVVMCPRAEPKRYLDPNINRPYLWIRITHVCRQWRDVALQSTKLWCWIVPSPPEWVQVLVQRSGQARLCIDTRPPPRNHAASRSRPPLLLSSMHDYMYRVYEARIDVYRAAQRDMDAPALRVLYVDNGQGIDENMPLFRAQGIPSLRSVSWHATAGSLNASRPLLLPQLEALHVALRPCHPLLTKNQVMSVDAWVSVLRSMPRLRTLSLIGAISRPDPTHVSDAHTVALPHLEDLVLSTADYDDPRQACHAPEVALLAALNVPRRANMTLEVRSNPLDTDALLMLLSTRTNDARDELTLKVDGPEPYSWTISKHATAHVGFGSTENHPTDVVKVYSWLPHGAIVRLCSGLASPKIRYMRLMRTGKRSAAWHNESEREVCAAAFRTLANLAVLVVEGPNAARLFLDALEHLTDDHGFGDTNSDPPRCPLPNLRECTLDGTTWRDTQQDTQSHADSLTKRVSAVFSARRARGASLRVLRIKNAVNLAGQDVEYIRAQNAVDVVEWDAENP
ncbi:hypothetical protein NM688_g5740 [Phlebia brevispora]|uniref:Uncharacterized protein n=1 Tax=Phlebia brevispora TaxID=194682 RepID=A0ACC1SQL5_9APHY|nr:hypothetical protein NM688_g5740 [Phlebia brevispora]